MGGLEELQAAVLHERNLVAQQLELELRTVAARPEEHRLLAQSDSRLASREDPGDDVVRLRTVVRDRHQAGPGARAAARGQLLAVLPARLADQGVGTVEHALGRAVVLLQRDHRRRRYEALRKLEDVVDRRGPERVDGLGVVADDRNAVTVRLHRQHDLGLQGIGVLVLVDQHVIEQRPLFAGERRVLQQTVPVEQEVVVVEEVLGLLALHVGAHQRHELGLELHAPRPVLLERPLQWPQRIDPMRIDRQARVLAREAPCLRRQAELVAQDVDQIGGIAPVDDAEAGIESDVVGLAPEDPARHRMEGPRPGQADGGQRAAVPLRQGRRDDPFRTAGHLGGGPSRKRQQQDSRRIDAGEQQVRDPVRERRGLAGAGTGNDQQRPGPEAAVAADGPVAGSETLCGIQRIGEHGSHGRIIRRDLYIYPVSPGDRRAQPGL